ncbi:4'-phosphopantetheinyl transferase family protein [Desulfolithobacter sp.]
MANDEKQNKPAADVIGKAATCRHSEPESRREPLPFPSLMSLSAPWISRQDNPVRHCITLAPQKILHHNHSPKEVLGRRELAHFHNFSREKRRREWLAGRISAKLAALTLLGQNRAPLPTLAIGTEPGGRPVPMGHQSRTDQPLFLSITHSGDLAGGMAAHVPCGLDLQEISARVTSVQERFTGPEEKKILLQITDVQEKKLLTMIWAAKEAIKKCFLHDRSAVFGETSLIAARPEKEGILLVLRILDLAPAAEVRLYDLENYILAVTFDISEPVPADRSGPPLQKDYMIHARTS